MAIVMYESKFCPFCSRAKSLLKQKGATFTEINVDMKPEVRAEMTKKAGGATSVPQIWIDDIHVGGCDDLHALDRKGQLDGMLALSD